MGFNLHFLKLFCPFIFFLFLVISNFVFPSTSHGIQPKTSPKEPAQYQVFYIKNAQPFFLDDNEGLINKKKKNKKGKVVKKRRKQIKNFKTRAFSVMLPKGFVPPSGSSPCHNEKPTSRLTFHCDLSSNTKP
ncbi:hypothetical protein JCGZ_04607 [Jatropha curcas]|uniref:Uncharacterized protein n=1 Tax=Jatropha curcas TaxID=180498 RepID=A0A067L1H6_JATCU|nr:hypothetical protein JCGZ_04607 [Jatropha curcas]